MADQAGPVRFGIADYILLSLMLGVSLIIGVYFAISGRKRSTRVEYLLGGRKLGALPVCLSLFATFNSAVALLGIPTEMYSYGTMMVYAMIGSTMSYLLAMVTAVPLFFPLQLTSVYEYLYLRFESRAVRVLGSGLGMMTNIAYMTVALLSPALALETAVGVPLWLSVVLIGCVGTLYTTLGGIKSVVWTDVFQTLVIFAGVFTILIKACIDIGGSSTMWEEVQASGRLEFDNVSPDIRTRHTVWNLTIGFMLYFMAIHFNQSSVQRLLSTKTIRDAYKVQIFTVPLNAAFNGTMIITGLVMIAYFRVIGCDPLEAGYVQNKNQIVPYFVLHTLRFLPGFAGLYISTIFSGALSTLSSGINALAANMVEDFLAGPLRGKHEAIITAVTKFFSCFFGAAIIGLAYLTMAYQGPVTQMAYTAMGATSGPIFGLFLLGGLFPQVNHLGAIIGCVSGLIINAWMSVGSALYGYRWPSLPPGPTDQCPVDNSTVFNNSTDYTFTTSTVFVTEFLNATDATTVGGIEDRPFSVYDVSYIWSPTFGLLSTLLVGIIVSLITNQIMSIKYRPQAKYLFPFCRKFWYGDMDVVETELRENVAMKR